MTTPQPAHDASPHTVSAAPPVAERSRNLPGVISLVIGVVLMLVGVVSFVILQTDSMGMLRVLALISAIVELVLALVGIVFGIVGAVRTGAPKLAAGIGIGIAGSALLSTLASFAISAVFSAL